MKISLPFFRFNPLILGLFFLSAATLGFADWQQPPEQFSTPPNPSSGTVGATDGHGNALAAWQIPGGVQASYYTNGAWGPFQTFPGVGEPRIAMDASGTGLLIFANPAANEIHTSFFNGMTWTTPTPDPLATPEFTIQQAIAMNGNGKGAANWNDFSTETITASFFSAGTWSTPVVIGTGTSPRENQIAYSANGTAVSLWVDTTPGTIVVSNYNGTAWEAQQTIGTSGNTTAPFVGMDAEGNATAGWVDPAGNVIAANYKAGTWTTQTISPGPGNTGVSLAMAPGGTAVLVWQNSAQDGLSSSYNGTTWGPVIQFGSSLVADLTRAGVSVDDVGNALVVYESSATNQVLSASLPLGGTWAAPLVVADDPNGPSAGTPYVSALSSGGRGFAFWTELITEDELPLAFASAFIPPVPPITPPTPPVSISGRTCNDKFASQTDRIHIITWVPSTDPTVVSYYLRRNGVLIAIIPAAGPYIYLDHNRCKNRSDAYSLTSVNGAGLESTPLSIGLR